MCQQRWCFSTATPLISVCVFMSAYKDYVNPLLLFLFPYLLVLYCQPFVCDFFPTISSTTDFRLMQLGIIIDFFFSSGVKFAPLSQNT